MTYLINILKSIRNHWKISKLMLMRSLPRSKSHLFENEDFLWNLIYKSRFIFFLFFKFIIKDGVVSWRGMLR